MGTYNSIEEFYAQMQKDVIKELETIAIKVQQDIRLYFLENIYNYTPQVYERTNLLLNSCKVSPVQNKNGEFYIEIYIDHDTVHANPAWYDETEMGIEVGDYMTLDEIAEHFAISMDKNAVGAVNEVWENTGRFINEMMSFLRSKYDVLG
jgi:hypothetical protein